MENSPMEKFGVLLFVLCICVVESCNNFNYDSLVYFANNSAKGLSRRNVEKEVGDFLDVFSLSSIDLYAFVPGGSECKADVAGVFEGAKDLNLWALLILDASSKTPSGIFSGNLNQYGDYDECLTAKGHTKNRYIQGKYCLVNVAIKINNGNENKLKLLDAAIHSNWILHNEFKDEGHRIPKFETFNVGVCVPNSCTANDVAVAFDGYLTEKSKNGVARFEIFVSDDVCYTQKENNFSTVTVTVWLIFSLIFTLVVLGTLVDVKKIPLNPLRLKKVLLCFSLKRNITTLIKTTTTPDDIKCIHGARFLNAVALLLSHKQIAMLYSPIQNRTPMSESFSKSWTMIGRAAILYTDSFIFISGLLISYSIIKDLDNKKKMNFKEKFINRIIRLLPNLVGVILFCTYIMEYLGSGPQWGLVVSKYTNLCKMHMWRNFLFIHNYFGFENMCLTHTHQLGIDMQLFLASPIFIYLIWKTPKIGVLVATAVGVVSTWLRYDVTMKENLSTLLYYGISVEQLWKTANKSYIMPTHRLTVYLSGIVMGYFLRRKGKNLNLSLFQATIGWMIALSSGAVAVFGLYRGAYKEYEYDVQDAAVFNAFAPVLWTVFVSWCLLASVNGYGGIFNDFLSWKYFLIFTRISYAVYLMQFPVFFYNVGSEKTTMYYKGFHSLFDISEMGLILLASVALTLTFDMPFQELKKALTSDKVKTEEKSQTAENQGRKKLQTFGT